ncbi:MAG TPA: hypothetical protein VFF53_08935 [Geobacteraceae bacterium]|nr:hypothetical protein [Geobacteraceae bacterium]
MFSIDPNGQKQFLGGHEDWQSAALLAAHCQKFLPDVEEELVADDPRSCYNCRLRRWTVSSFTCTGTVTH